MDSPPHPPARVHKTTLDRVVSEAANLRQQPGGVNNELLSLSLWLSGTHPLPEMGSFELARGPITQFPGQLGRGQQGRAQCSSPAAPLASPGRQLPPSSGSAPRVGWWGPSPRTPRPRLPRTRSPGGSRRPAALPLAAPAYCPARPRRAGAAAPRGRNPPRRPWFSSVRAGRRTRAAPAPRHGWRGRRQRGGRAWPWLRAAARTQQGERRRVRPAAPLGSRWMWCRSRLAPGALPARLSMPRAPGAGPRTARAPTLALPGFAVIPAGVKVESTARGAGLEEATVAGVSARGGCRCGNLDEESPRSDLTLPVFRRRCTPRIASKANLESVHSLDRATGGLPGDQAKVGMILL